MATHSFNQDSLSHDPVVGPKKNNAIATLPLSAMGVTSLVMGILALAISWIPIINNITFLFSILDITFLFSILGLAFAIVAFVGIKHHKVRGRGLAYAGLITSIVGFAIMLATQSFYGEALKGVSKAVNDVFSDSSTSDNDSAENQEKSQDTNNGNKDASEGEIDGGAYHVTIEGAELSDEDYDGNPTVLVTYKVVNKQKDQTSSPFDWKVEVFQNGVALSDHPIYREKPKGLVLRSDHYGCRIEPRGQFGYVEAFVIKDKKAPIRVEISSSWKDENKITKEFNLS
ncbi:DUF5067 domain-containing protein [Fannyhessea vaginae]|uniref:DUF5067 domain-containing protein n=1 Tax=Fannyhessea vaginae TaxID=82135 RepID=UPI003A80839A